jgi:hypothetical protein
MWNPALFHILLDHLEAIGMPLAGINRFVDRWHKLRSHERFFGARAPVGTNFPSRDPEE